MKTFGILNITTDSFSDGGQFLAPPASLQKADSLLADGCWAVDIGAQSSNPDATLVSEATEWDRLAPVISHLRKRDKIISVDTFRPEVIRKSIAAGVHFINNINSFQDDSALEVLRDHRENLPGLIVMHSVSGSIAGRDSELRPDNVIGSILSFFDKITNRLLQAGVPEGKIIYDPGMGFFLGADPELSIRVMQNVDVLRERLGQVMVSVSRKSFIGKLLGNLPPAERSAGTLACESWLVMKTAVDYIRTHDVRQLLQAQKLLAALDRA